MTREEQIRQAAKGTWDEPSFISGAEWADNTPKNPWISVNDRLPEEGQHIVMYDSAYDDYGTIYYPEPYITDNMDYWMPIPDIPKENCL